MNKTLFCDTVYKRYPLVVVIKQKTMQARVEFLFGKFNTTHEKGPQDYDKKEFQYDTLSLIYECNALCSRYLLSTSTEENNRGIMGPTWAKASRAVIQFACVNYARFWEPRDWGGTMKSNTSSILEMLYRIYLKCALCRFEGKLFSGPSAFKGIRATDIEFVKNNALVRSRKPIGEYSVHTLLDALMQLDWQWLRLRFDSQLLLYMQLLEYRASELIFLRNPPHMYDADGFCTKEGEGEEECTTNWAFMRSITTVLVNMNRRLLAAQTIPRANRQRLMMMMASQFGTPEDTIRKLAMRLRDRFHAKLSKVSASTMQSEVARNYMALSCKYSEVLRYMIDVQAGRKTTLYKKKSPGRIIKHSRGTMVNEIINQSQVPPARMLDTPESVIPFAPALVAINLVHKSFHGNAAISFNNMVFNRLFGAYAYDPANDKTEYIMDAALDIPSLVQTFNHFRLVWRRTQYESTDVIEAIVCMICIIAKTEQYYIDKRSLKVVIADLFGDANVLFDSSE